MNRGDDADYCSFTKAVEHLGDRWSLLIIADLALFGPQGFNALAAGLPGRISRSVLAARLHKLESLGLVSHDGRPGRGDPYQLTTAGHGLAPTIRSLRGWATTWLPDDPAVVERDPDIVLAWLTRRTEASRLPGRRTVVEFRTRHEREHRWWLVIQRDRVPYACFDDPLLDDSRYVFIDAPVVVLLALVRGRLDWAVALADGSVSASGDPVLVRQLPDWFGQSRRT